MPATDDGRIAVQIVTGKIVPHGHARRAVRTEAAVDRTVVEVVHPGELRTVHFVRSGVRGGTEESYPGDRKYSSSRASDVRHALQNILDDHGLLLGVSITILSVSGLAIDHSASVGAHVYAPIHTRVARDRSTRDCILVLIIVDTNPALSCIFRTEDSTNAAYLCAGVQRGVTPLAFWHSE